MAETITQNFSSIRSLSLKPGYFAGFYPYYHVVAAPFSDSGVAQIRVGFDFDPLVQYQVPRQFAYDSYIPGGSDAQDITLADGDNPRLANMDELFKMTNIFSTLEDAWSGEIFLLTDK